MIRIPLGQFDIARVADLDSAALPTRRGFPELTDDRLRGYLDELGPRHVDPVTLDLLVSFHTWLIRRGDRVVLVDLCVGNHKDRPRVPDWHQRSGNFLERLAGAGVKPEDVDAVLCTHLHADHVGWNTRLENGRWVPTFPKARYLMAEKEYRHWTDRHAVEGNGLNYGSFADSVLPVVESGQADMVSCDHRVEPGIHLEGMPGHTPGSVLIHIEDGGKHGIFTGDLLHHPFQLANPGVRSGFCDDPALSSRNRVALCERYADTGTRMFTAHFADPSTGFILRDGKRFRFRFDPGSDATP